MTENTEKTFDEKLKEMTVAQLREGLEYWENEHVRMQYADDFYYSNGGWESTQRTIDAYKKAIEERENAS